MVSVERYFRRRERVLRSIFRRDDPTQDGPVSKEWLGAEHRLEPPLPIRDRHEDVGTGAMYGAGIAADELTRLPREIEEELIRLSVLNLVINVCNERDRWREGLIRGLIEHVSRIPVTLVPFIGDAADRARDHSARFEGPPHAHPPADLLDFDAGSVVIE